MHRSTTENSDGDATKAAGSPWHRTALIVAAKTAAVALAVYLISRLVSGIGWQELRERALAADPVLLVVAAVLLSGRWLVWQHRWYLALAGLGEKNTHRRCFAALIASIFVNHVTPTARVLGGIVRTRYVARPWGGRFRRVFAATLFDQLVHHTVVGLATWLALISGAVILGRYKIASVAGLALAIVTLLVILRAAREERAEPGVRSVLLRTARERVIHLAPVLGRGRQTLQAVRSLLQMQGLVVRAALWSAMVFATTVAAQWVFFPALGIDISPLRVAAVVGLGGLAGAIFGTPGGVGSTEAAMISAFVTFGVERTDAVAATFLFRGLHYCLVLGLGLPSFLFLELQRVRRRRSVQPHLTSSQNRVEGDGGALRDLTQIQADKPAVFHELPPADKDVTDRGAGRSVDD